MPLNLDWRDAVVEHEGVRLVARYVPRPYVQVFMKQPFDGLHVLHLGEQPTEEELPGLVEEILVGIHRTCLWVQANQEELRARYRPVVEAGENSDEHMSSDRHDLARRTLEDMSNISPEEMKQLLKPLDERRSVWNDLRVATLERALDELGYDWPYARWVVDRLAPHFDPHRASELRKRLEGE
jgi:hypothetical protein